MTDLTKYTLSTGDVARRLGVHRNTIQRWADAGHIASVRTIGGQRRFSNEDVEAFAGQIVESMNTWSKEA